MYVKHYNNMYVLHVIRTSMSCVLLFVYVIIMYILGLITFYIIYFDSSESDIYIPDDKPCFTTIWSEVERNVLLCIYLYVY